MENNILISINIVSINNDDKILLNKSLYPLLFYYTNNDNNDINKDFNSKNINNKNFNSKNINNEIFNNLYDNDNFIEYIKDICCNEKYYHNSSVNLIYFIDSDDEKYEEMSKNIQDFLLLEQTNNEFYFKYVLNIFYDLYIKAFHEAYKKKDKSIKDEIKSIYDIIQEKFPNKFVKSTVINYLRKELSEIFNNKNTDFILSKVENIF